MAATHAIYAQTTVSMTDLRRNPSGILEDAGDSPIAVLNHNKPAAYLLSAKAYEALLDRLDDAELTKIVKQRQGGKRVKVTLEAL
ncbi:type II toxin-antitoxin system prevent-host-death family antitoxin [Rhodoferax saidenbachensis]|uniref:Antitoxin n=1 Tax=Rhodoferax saidenbachensis TaxID=1484693 RepID=A0A1P8KDY7_9BURK|nr:type II toxin-antitoxin system prevent-host-death family antitoxin [Rhodoferax saidenbachensis]APW44219.1 prevent-host-death protein [Rhodoferax saidenbachensis]